MNKEIEIGNKLHNYYKQCKQIVGLEEITIWTLFENLSTNQKIWKSIFLH